MVENEIPLLSKKSVKNIGMALDFKSDATNIGGSDISLCCTKSGYYSIPLSTLYINMKGSNRHINLHMSHLKDLSKEEKKRKVVKLQCHIAQPSKEKLVKLIKKSKDFCDKEFVGCARKCCRKCEIC